MENNKIHNKWRKYNIRQKSKIAEYYSGQYACNASAYAVRG